MAKKTPTPNGKRPSKAFNPDGRPPQWWSLFTAYTNGKYADADPTTIAAQCDTDFAAIEAHIASSAAE